MSKKNDGGPAFPVADYDPRTFTPETVDGMRRLLSGMSLRAYIATNIDIGQTFPGMIERALEKASATGDSPTIGHMAKKAAELRVIAADALIAELERDQ